FSTCSSFSSNYRTPCSSSATGSSQPAAWPASMQVRGSGSQLSMSYSTSVQSGWGSGASLRGIGGIQSEKETMQCLNDCLASYLERVRSLEADNRSLEIKILEHLGKKVRDWRHYFKTIEDLRAQIFAESVGNACIVLQTDSACPAADDFRVKYETALAVLQSVGSDINGLRKVLDDTNITRLQLETEIEALKDELIFMRKKLTVELVAPKSQDLSKIMADIPAQYDELAWKNQEELDKYWSQQTEESTTVTTEIGAAEMTITELRRMVQSLEIDLDSIRSLKAGLEKSLREVEMRYAVQVEQLNRILLHLESELAQAQAQGQRQTQEYKTLLNIKDKLEFEVATYRRLLEEGEDFHLSDALDSSQSMQSIQKTTTCRIVDGKIVSEVNDTKVLR
uniref:IF rod domain-containing protein n=1 Tax=Myotis lucifugus TaxID=59463 RepID=G1Q8Q9_MYOLU